VRGCAFGLLRGRALPDVRVRWMVLCVYDYLASLSRRSRREPVYIRGLLHLVGRVAELGCVKRWPHLAARCFFLVLGVRVHASALLIPGLCSVHLFSFRCVANIAP
jgi:hypothetical protein